jgi:hypothetical protein
MKPTTPSYRERVHALMRQRGFSELLLCRLDVELRRKIAEEDHIPPDRLDAAVEQVMAEMFKTLSH